MSNLINEILCVVPNFHEVVACGLIGRVHTAMFTRRAYRSRTVRLWLPVYTLRPLRRVRAVHSYQTTSGCVLIVLERYASGWRCSVEARVDASGVAAMRRMRMSADWRIVSTTLICNAANCARRNHDTVG